MSIYHKLAEVVVARKYLISVLFLLILGLSVRLTGISALPAGLNQDEASIGYEAYSILKTGIDRNGNSYPVHLESWGSGQNALYAYLSMPFIHFFGLNAFSVRIVNALLSCISLLMFFLLFRIGFDRKKALAALALFAIFPWSIMSARWGLESNILPAFFLVGAFFLIKGYNSSPWYYLLSVVIFAFSLYSYGVTYLVLPMFFVLVIPYMYFNKKISIRFLLLGFGLFLIVALPIILFVLINHLNLQPIHLGGITIPRLEANRTTVVFNLFNGNFISTLAKNSVRFLSVLVLQADGTEYNAIPMFGTIYPISLVFFVVGLWGAFKNRTYFQHYVFLCWFLCSVVLGITSHVNINRVNIIFIPLLYFVVLGVFDVLDMLKAEYKRNYKYLIIGLYSLLFVLFCGYYGSIFKENIKNDFSFGLKEAIQFAEKQNNVDRINVTTRTINMPYIYVCFYNHLDPAEFRKSVRYSKKTINAEFRVVEQLGRYSFGTNLSDLKSIHILSREEMDMLNTPIAFSRDFGNYSVVKFVNN